MHFRAIFLLVFRCVRSIGKGGRPLESATSQAMHIDYCIHYSWSRQKCFQSFSEPRHRTDDARESKDAYRATEL